MSKIARTVKIVVIEMLLEGPLEGDRGIVYAHTPASLARKKR
jgi:hypothetical protein